MDLVDKLRSLGDHANYVPHMHHIAANEIDKLRGLVDRMATLAVDNARDTLKVREELENLRRGANQMEEQWNRLQDMLQDREEYIEELEKRLSPQGFEDWLNEIENFSTRRERLLEEFDGMTTDRLYEWLLAAYLTGKSSTKVTVEIVGGGGN